MPAALSPACRSWGSEVIKAWGLILLMPLDSYIGALPPADLLAWLPRAQTVFERVPVIGSKATPQDLQIRLLRLKSLLKVPLIDLLQALP